MSPEGLALLVCPLCRGSLSPSPSSREPIREGKLDCAGCRASWPIERGLPRLYREEAVRGTDRLMRLFTTACRACTTRSRATSCRCSRPAEPRPRSATGT